MKPTKNFEDLVDIVKTLRRECPWDRKQTHDSIKDNLIEEAYEAVEAIDRRDFDELKKELGDLLLHVIFQTNLASENDHFDIGDVIRTIQEKMIRRHPHVYGDTDADDEQQVAENWEIIKMDEGKSSVLEGIPASIPALIRAQRMQEKASNVGFDWPGRQEVWEKLEEEIDEFRQTLDKNNPELIEEEFGDLLFSLVNVGRFFDLNAEDALRLTNRKFEKRFRYIEEQLLADNKTPREATLEEMDRHWNQAKSDD